MESTVWVVGGKWAMTSAGGMMNSRDFRCKQEESMVACHVCSLTWRAMVAIPITILLIKINLLINFLKS